MHFSRKHLIHFNQFINFRCICNYIFSTPNLSWGGVRITSKSSYNNILAKFSQNQIIFLSYTRLNFFKNRNSMFWCKVIDQCHNNQLLNIPVCSKYDDIYSNSQQAFDRIHHKLFYQCQTPFFSSNEVIAESTQYIKFKGYKFEEYIAVSGNPQSSSLGTLLFHESHRRYVKCTAKLVSNLSDCHYVHSSPV